MRPEFKFGLVGGLLVLVLSVGSYLALKKSPEPLKELPVNGPNSAVAKPPSTAKPGDVKNAGRPTDGKPVRTPLDSPKPATPPANNAANPPAGGSSPPPATRLNNPETKTDATPLSGAALNPSPGLLPQEPLTSRPATTIILPEVKTPPPPADTPLSNRPDTNKPSNLGVEPPKTRPTPNDSIKTDTARRSVDDRGANDGSPKPKPAPTTAGANQYTIQPGDRLSDIARDHYGDAGYWRQIKDANPGLDENRLLVGKTIVLPPREAKVAVDKNAKNAAKSKTAADKTAGSTAGTPSKKGTLTSSTAPTPITNATSKPSGPTAPPRTEKKPVAPGAKPDSAAATPGSKPVKSAETYTVAPSDTLRSIARKLLGSDKRWREIYDLNHDKLKSPDTLYVGLVLKMPAK